MGTEYPNERMNNVFTVGRSGFWGVVADVKVANTAFTSQEISNTGNQHVLRHALVAKENASSDPVSVTLARVVLTAIKRWSWLLSRVLLWIHTTPSWFSPQSGEVALQCP